MGVDQPPEVAILGQEDAPLGPSHLDDDAVVGSTRNLGHGEDLMARGTQRPKEGVIAGLVAQKSHSSAGGALRGRDGQHRLLVGDRVRSVGDRRVDVLQGEARVGVE